MKPETKENIIAMGQAIGMFLLLILISVAVIVGAGGILWLLSLALGPYIGYFMLGLIVCLTLFHFGIIIRGMYRDIKRERAEDKVVRDYNAQFTKDTTGTSKGSDYVK